MVTAKLKAVAIASLILAACVTVAAQAATPGPHSRHVLGESVLPHALAGGQYAYQFESDLRDPDPTYTVSAGTLPTGISMTAAGLLSGVAKADGNTSFTVSASNGNGKDVSQPLTLAVVSAPLLTSTNAQTITSTTADLSAHLDPGNLSTNTWFEYWPTSNPAGLAYTEMQTVPPGTTPVAIATQITGLEPATDYMFRATASNEISPKGVFTEPIGLHTDGLPPPVAGQSFNLEPVEGTTATKCADDGAFKKLNAPKQVTLDCEVDTNHGTVALTASKGSSGETQTAQFWGGLFDVNQKAGDNQAAVLGLAGGLRCEKRVSDKHSRVGKRARRKGGGRKLWGSGGGNYKTVGSHGAAIVRGTIWLVQDRCDGATLFKVKKGVVTVEDFVKGTTLTLEAGQQYIAKAAGGRLP